MEIVTTCVASQKFESSTATMTPMVSPSAPKRADVIMSAKPIALAVSRPSRLRWKYSIARPISTQHQDTNTKVEYRFVVGGRAMMIMRAMIPYVCGMRPRMISASAIR